MNNRARGSNDSQQLPKTAKELIAANVQSLIEQLEAGHSDALTAHLNAMGRFRNYSFGNILEIARQRPDATRVAGMYAWNQLGRRVKKGARHPHSGADHRRQAQAERRSRPNPHVRSFETKSIPNLVRDAFRTAIAGGLASFISSCLKILLLNRFATHTLLQPP